MLLKRWNSPFSSVMHIFDVDYNEKNFLSFFRVTVCLIALFDVISMLADFRLLFAQSGTVVPQELIYLPSEYFGRLQSLFGIVKRYHVESAFYSWIFWIYLSSLVTLMSGLFSRASAIVALVCQLIIFRSFAPFNYGYDHFLTMSFFYCAVFPVGKYYSLDRKIFRGTLRPEAFNYQRVLQIHLCIVYFFSGIAKIVDVGWWNGNSIWRSVASIYTNYHQIPPLLMAITGVGVIFIETLYPVLMFRRPTRKVMILLVILMHLSIGYMLELYSFAAIMIVWNISAFGRLTSTKKLNEDNL